MVISCYAYNCTNRYGQSDVNGKITFHRFPVSNKEVCSKWINAVRRENFHPTVYHYLCSEHFEESCYCSGYVNRCQLKAGAVPSVFNFPPHLMKCVLTSVNLDLVRSRLGGSNNPTFMQFKAAYKQLLVNNTIICRVNGNCVAQDETALLPWKRSTRLSGSDPILFSNSRRFEKVKENE